MNVKRRLFRMRDKRERNERLRHFAYANPELTQEELGEMFGIDRSRVSRILAINKANDNES